MYFISPAVGHPWENGWSACINFLHVSEQGQSKTSASTVEGGGSTPNPLSSLGSRVSFEPGRIATTTIGLSRLRTVTWTAHLCQNDAGSFGSFFKCWAHTFGV